MPNAFTPNNDGKNDRFGLPPSNNNVLINFSIYNRWGTRVFTSADRHSMWDGTIAGIPQPTGVYVYHLLMKGLSGDRFEKKGTVLLIR
jgi:gliding motility-associated-like protein